MPSLPIGAGFYESEIDTLLKLGCKNWIPINAPSGAVNDSALLDRSGIVQFATLSGEHRGAIRHNGVYLTLNGTTLSSIDSSGTVTTIGTILGTGRVSIAKNDDYVVFVTKQGDGYGYNVGAGTVAQITDSDYVLSSSVVFVDGYFVFTQLNGEKFFISNLNDPFTIDALDFSTAEERPDPIVGAYVYNNTLHVLGTETIEKYNNQGGVNFPFIRIRGASNTVGCYAKHTLMEAGQGFVFVGGSVNEGAQIYFYSGNAPKAISSPGIENPLQDFNEAEIGNAFAQVWKDKGQLIVAITIPSARITSRTFCVNLTSGKYFELSSDDKEYRAKSTVRIYDKFLVGDDGGKCGYLDGDTKTDYGDVIKRETSFQPLVNEGDSFVINTLELWFEAGVGLTSGQGSDPIVSLEISKDLGKTFTPEKWRKVGKLGNYGQRTVWRRLGFCARDLVVRVKASDPAKFNLMKATFT